MIQIFPFEKRVEYVTEKGSVLVACRSYLLAEFRSAMGEPILRQVMLDSGAPWGVLPHSFWSKNQIPWQPIGSQIRRSDRVEFEPITWQGIPCSLGELSVDLLDERTGVRTRPLRLLAKLPEAPGTKVTESEVLFGLGFFRDNSLSHTISGVNGVLICRLDVS